MFQESSGAAFVNAYEPGWAVKVFYARSQPNAAQRELQNLALARQEFPDNVVKTKPLLNPRNPRGQNFVVKEQVTLHPVPPAEVAKKDLLAKAMERAGVQDPAGNLFYGTTPINPTKPTWYLVE